MWSGWWWDDAMREARSRATLTGKRQRVTREGESWAVVEVGA